MNRIYLPIIILIAAMSVGVASCTGDENTAPDSPTQYHAFSIPAADIEYTNPFVVAPEIIRETGIFTAQSILLEAIENGTTTLSSAEVYDLLRRNTLTNFETPSNDGSNMYEEELKFIEVLREGPQNASSGHSNWMIAEQLAVTAPVLERLNKKILVSMELSPSYNEEFDIHYVQTHPDWHFFMSKSYLGSDWSGGPVSLDEITQLTTDGKPAVRADMFDNVYFFAWALGNNPHLSINAWEDSVIYGPTMVGTLEQAETGEYGWAYAHLVYGCDVVMGSRYDGVTNGVGSYEMWKSTTYVTSVIPTLEYASDSHVWSGSSSLYAECEASSPACANTSAKAYLATCVNMLANPSITRDENRILLRDNALDGVINKDGLFYATSKRMNPGGMLFQMFSRFPESISVASSELIPIAHSIHANSIVVGPGIVNGNGIEITADNYREMIGQPLFVSPDLLRRYGYVCGDTAEYTEHLCCDSIGTGAHGRASEAHKSIISKTFTVSCR